MISPLVLLVDDEVPFVETMSKRLSKRQLMVLPAYSWRVALQRLRKNAVEVVILDVKMPGMDGIETLREIKEDSVFARLEGRDQDFVCERLKGLGYLTIHTRQLDMIMSDPASARNYWSKIRKDLGSIITSSI